MKNITETQARAKAERIKKFYIHSLLFVIGLAIYVLKTYCGFPLNFWPIKFLNGAFISIWALIFLISAIKFLILENTLGEKWEQKKIDSLMNKNNNTSKNWE